uniref:CSON008633 protein n=1 Tax=Culicoides sonorensis TaxID=179676 RepID=A0A336N1J6_CULSO
MPSAMKRESNLAAFTFFAKSLGTGDICGSNGLPILPNSISIMGRSQYVKSLKHPNLCEFLGTLRGKHERTVVVSEYNGTPLNEFNQQFDQEDILRIFYQVATALNFMHEHDLTHNSLEPSNILIDTHKNVKLFNFGLFYMTNSGKYVSFPIGNVKYTAPERLLGMRDNIKGDVWSIALIVAELVLGCTFWANLKICQVTRKILSLLSTNNVLEKIAREHERYDEYTRIDSNLKTLLESCLDLMSDKRPLPNDIIENEIFIEKEKFEFKAETPKSLLMRCPLSLVYYLWQLAGGDVLSDLKKEGLIKNEAPILLMPNAVLLDGKEVALPKSQNHLFDPKIIFLSLNNLMEKVSKIPKRDFFPLIHTPKYGYKIDPEYQKLPLIIRERDTIYQFYRMMLMSRLIQGYPYTRDMIIEQSRQFDIPPPLRGKIWSCILGVIKTGKYEWLDKETPTSTDRQIEVDIPRCHQYDELLSSPDGHLKLKRLLKAWVVSHPHYVYWQGLDSLTAVFLHLNFNDEEIAYESLCKFISKYLHWFFLKDNSAIIKECLAKFSQLTAFHEPAMAKHLATINFIPELFAIPWFLTMFSHVFPLHKVMHLWDKLMLGDHSYPLFIGIAILRQLKSTLLQSGFNECILLFSDLPDIVIENCVTESQKMYESTPKSVCYRKYVEKFTDPDILDIANLELADIQKETSPRISANDLLALLPDKAIILDIRSNPEFNRQHVQNSINIPFSQVKLGEMDLASLDVPDLAKMMTGKIVVIVSAVHENAILFSKYLVDLGISQVCILHRGFQILHNISPSILVSC